MLICGGFFYIALTGQTDNIMIEQIISPENRPYEWIDLTNPSTEELSEIAARFGLHPELVKDCLQPGHLPKLENLDKYSFLIFRVYTESDFPEADTVQELTNKIAIFYSEKFIITLHRRKQNIFSNLRELTRNPTKCSSSLSLLNELIWACLRTFEEPSQQLAKSVDYYEEITFLKPKKAPLLRGLYYLKRKTDLIRRMLKLSYPIIDFIDDKSGNVMTRDTRDYFVKLQSQFDDLSENTHQLLNIYFSASAQRTNETMRILTIFSVFFMPLTFIVGIYGMNFEFMPELKARYGYPIVLGVMAVVIIIIFFWFKKKKWL
ncbi:MAG: CorA family divalent cation transporter [Chitinophagaceae bacterium]|jgi:magnesium transporter